MTDKPTKMVYMIQRDSDGLFSSGGMDVRFTKKGKAWNSLGDLKNHLHQFHSYSGQPRTDYPYHGCTIVTLEKVVVIRPVVSRDDWTVDKMFDELRGPALKRYGGTDI